MPKAALKHLRFRKNRSLMPAERESKKAGQTHASGPLLAQQAIGNQAMQRMLQAKILQAKLTVNQSGDEYEKEADQVADTVMRMPKPLVGMPPSEPEKDEEKRLQTKPLFGQDALIQREEVSEDEKKKKKDEEKQIQTKSLSGEGGSLIQREADAENEDEKKKKDEEKKPLQTKPLFGQDALIQREEVSEDEEKKKKDEEKQIQTKSLSGQSPSLIQREAEAGAEEDKKRKDEEEKQLQTKSISEETPSILEEARDEKRKARGENEELGIISRKIASDKVGTTVGEDSLQNLGQGQPLNPTTRAFFETRLGQDFSHVRLHTGPRAEEATRSISAKAYTIGENIAFGSGRYSPNSQEGRWLLAHELTHVIQQGGVYSKNDRKKPLAHELVHVVQQPGSVQKQPNAPKKDTEELKRVKTLSDKYKSAVEDARKGDDAKWFEVAVLLNGFNISDIFDRLKELSPDDRNKMRDKAGWVTRVSESIELLNRGLTEGRDFEEIKEEAIRREKSRFKGLEENYQRAIKGKAWSDVALLLNAFSSEDILIRLRPLPKDQIAAIYKGAIENPRVGPNSNIALIIIGQYTSGIPDLSNIKNLESVQKAINEKKYQEAIDLLLPSLPINTALLKGGKMFYSPAAVGSEDGGLSTPKPSPTVTTGPTLVQIVTPAFLKGVPGLYSTIMHEYQHVVQFHAGKESAAEGEVEAYAWEIIHSEQTKEFEIKPGQYEIETKKEGKFRTPIELLWWRLHSVYWSRLDRNKKKRLNHLYIMAHTVAMRADPESVKIKELYSPLNV